MADSNDELTAGSSEEKGALFFSYHDTEKTNALISEATEELAEVQKPRDQWSLPVIQRHTKRHECHLLSEENIYDVKYVFKEDDPEDKSYLTTALTSESAMAKLEDDLLRTHNTVASPIIKEILDYGPQPIDWCIDWSQRQLDNVIAHRDKLLKRQGTFVRGEQ